MNLPLFRVSNVRVLLTRPEQHHRSKNQIVSAISGILITCKAHCNEMFVRGERGIYIFERVQFIIMGTCHVPSWYMTSF